MTPEVEAELKALRAAFPDNGIEVHEEAQGGAYVLVHDLVLGEQYAPTRSWIGFLIPHTYPYADVYPHFTDPALARADGATLSSTFQRTSWRDQPVTQLSRRSNAWDATTDTAVVKLKKVLSWLATQ